MATVVERDPKAPFSIATTPRYRGGCYSFPRIDPFYYWCVTYNAECLARRHQVQFFESLVWLDLGLRLHILKRIYFLLPLVGPRAFQHSTDAYTYICVCVCVCVCACACVFMCEEHWRVIVNNNHCDNQKQKRKSQIVDHRVKLKEGIST